jgi:hypothetical protein
MAVVQSSLLSPKQVPMFKVGDNVHVFEVGENEGCCLVRKGGRDERGAISGQNWLLAGRGSPALVEGQYLTLQTDFGLKVGSGERTHYRSLPKRNCERLEQTVDRRNESVVKSVRQQIKKLKRNI